MALHRIASITTKRNSAGGWDARVTIHPKGCGSFSWLVPCSFLERRDARDMGKRAAWDHLKANTSEGTILLATRSSIYF